MKTKPFSLSWAGRGIVACLCLSLLMLPVPAFSDPPEDRGRSASEHQNKGNRNEHGASSHERGSETRSQGRSETARANLIKHMEAHQGGRKHLDFKGRASFGPEDFGSASGTNFSYLKSQSGGGHHDAFGKNENTRLIRDFEHALKKLENKDHGRWFYNPKDDWSQNNRGKLEMLDPYGHSFDDRMLLYGNRGRPIRSSPEPEPEPSPEPAPEPVPEPSPQPPPEELTYLTVTSATLAAWQFINYGWLYPEVTFEELGYSQAEADFLKSLSYDAILQAASDGYILLP